MKTLTIESQYLPNMDELDAHLIIIFSGLAFMCESLDIAKKYPIKMNSVKTINVTSKMRWNRLLLVAFLFFAWNQDNNQILWEITKTFWPKVWGI